MAEFRAFRTSSAIISADAGTSRSLRHCLCSQATSAGGRWSRVDLKKNAGTLFNYGARHRKGLPISSSIAEPASNQVVSYRMAKKRQMCWTALHGAGQSRSFEPGIFTSSYLLVEEY